jgi:peptidoglycan/LPS O-acetylase OafA/YrhL
MRDQMYTASPNVSPGPSPKNRSEVIDLLRGISILLVVLYHGDDFFTIQASALAALFPPLIADILFQSGYYGVTIFFVISGFLITRISLERYGALSAIRSGNFYLFRFGRIVPCFGLTLFVLLCLHFGNVRDFVYDTEKTPLSDLLTYTFTFRYNLLFCRNGWGLLPWDILWSLSIEEVFYLFFPVLCLLLRSRRALLACCLLLFIAGPIARLTGATNFDKLHGYFSCFDLIALGCATAIIESIVAKQVTARKHSLAVSGIGVVFSVCAITALPIPDYIVSGPTLLGTGIALVLFGRGDSKYRFDRWLTILSWPLS